MTLVFLVPEKSISILPSFDSRDQRVDQLKTKIILPYTAEHNNEITIRKVDIVDVIL